MPKFAPAGPFSRDIRETGLALVANQPTGRFADLAQLTRAVGFLALFIALYILLLAGGAGIGLGWLALAGGLSAFMFGVTVAHDAAHGALHPRRWVNWAGQFFGFAVFGISGAVWAWRHNRLHHMYPNVQGTDIDHEASPLLRLSPHSPWRWWHRFQPFYSPFLYAFLMGSVTWVEDFSYLKAARKAAPREFNNWRPTLEFAAAKTFHVLVLLVLPWACLDLAVWELVAGYLIATCVPSTLFSALVVGTHIAEEAAFHVPDEQDRLPHDWATHQMLTSVDWSPESKFAGLLTGGANAHTAHHLFPQVAHCHVPMLNDLVEQKVIEHNVPRNVVSFAGLIGSHFRLLGALARRPDHPLPCT